MQVFDLDLDPGQLRHRVALQQLTETADSYGQLLKSWTTQGTYWAFVKPLTGRELVNALQIKAEVNHAVVLRWNPDITVNPTFRLLYGTRVLSIEACLNIEERDVKLVVLAIEQVKPTVS